ncbi:MAG: sugar ABC transporter substrate-binding protein [Bauldia sp.]|nr:sugar ABC transporter substrate-binding protein [Bauldia sp.]
MKKAGIGLAALSALALMSSPLAAQDKPGAGLKVCLSLDKMNAFREGQVKFWRAAAEDLGVELVEQVAGEDAQRQSSQIDTCIAQGVDGIVSIPWDYEAVLQDIARAHDAGIPFITADQAPAETDTVDFHIGGDPYADGLTAGKRLVALVGDKPTKVVDLQGALSAVNGQGRDQGFKEGIADHPNIVIVSEVPTEWRPEPVVAGMENALQANPDLGAVFAATDGLLPPVWAALQKVDRYKPVGDPDHVVILSIDGDPQGCRAVREGWMDAGYATPIAQMTRRTLEVVVDIAKNDKKPEGDARIELMPGVEYTKDNLAETEASVWGCSN